MKKSLLVVIVAIIMLMVVIFSINILATDIVEAQETVLRGDVNNDEIVDTRDLIILRRYFASYDYDNPDENADIGDGADFNGDNKVNLSDVVALRSYLANQDYPEIPDNPDTPAMPDINLLLSPEQIQSYANSVSKRRLDAGEIIEDNDVEFLRYTTVDHAQPNVWLHVYSADNNTVATGEYAILKYRLSEGATSSTTWDAYASTDELTANGDGDKLHGTLPEIIDDGKWHIAIFKINAGNSGRFVADENGDYYANFFRLDFSATGTGVTLDIEYVAFTDDLNKVQNLTGDEKFDTDVFCTHYNTIQYKNAEYHSNSCVICGKSEDVMHSLEGNVEFDETNECYRGTCSICGSNEATSPFNLFVNAETLRSYTITPPFSSVSNKKSAQYISASDDDIAHVKLESNDTSNWLYFYYYYNMNCDKVTGQYFVIKYRLPEGATGNSIGTYVGSATSPNSQANSGENLQFVATANGGWVIEAYDLSQTKNYGANADGTYSAKYLRIDFYLKNAIDVAFIGVCDNLDGIYKVVGEDTTCKHNLNRYDVTAGTHENLGCGICKQTEGDGNPVAHSYSNAVYNEFRGGYIIKCSECGYEVVQESNSAVGDFFNPLTVKSKDNGASYNSAEILGDETEPIYVRFKGKASVPMTFLINNSSGYSFHKNNKESGHLLMIKYRFPSTNTVKPTCINLYVSSEESPTASADNMLSAKTYADGDWHIIIIDLQKAGTTEGFSGEKITLLRLDLFGWNTPGDANSIDIAYVAIDDNIDNLRAFDDDYDTWDLVGSSELKSTIGSYATQEVDEEHNGMPYVTLTGTATNYTTVGNSADLFQGAGRYVSILYRKPANTLVQCRMYYSPNNTYNNQCFADYISDEKWHLCIFDLSTYDFYVEGVTRTVRFDWFNHNPNTGLQIDIAYVKFFHTEQEMIDFYGEYVKIYLDQDNCDHLESEWSYGSDDDPNTDIFKEYAVCKHCGKQTDESRDISFNVVLDKVTDSNGTYPSAYDGTIGTAENSVISFNSTNYSELYPANGLTVAASQELSIAGRLSFNGDIESVWFKVVNASETVVSDWKECRYSISGSKFAAYADFDGIDGTNLTVIFAAVPSGLDERVVDAYLPIVSIEGISVSEEAGENASFTANADLGILMDNMFTGNKVTNETVMFLNYGDTKSLLYPIDTVISVKSYDGTVTYFEGTDYELVDGQIRILEGSLIPCITPDSYYNVADNTLVTNYNGVDTNTYYSDGNGMTKWQVCVEYTHTESWDGYTQDNQSDSFADFIEKLMNGEDVTIFYFGDSITAGANSSFFHGYGQKQYPYAIMLTNALADAFGYTVKYVSTNHLTSNMGKVPSEDYVGGTRGTITYVNTAVGGWGAGHGVQNFEKHVTNYINQYGCDLFICAFGMNDIGSSSSVSNIKNIVDGVYSLAPDTSVMLVSTMFYNNTSVQAETRNGNALTMDTKLKELAATYTADGRECGVTSMTLMSQSILTRKEFMDYSGNNVNHPNDFFGRVYAQTIFEALIGYENLAD